MIRVRDDRPRDGGGDPRGMGQAHQSSELGRRDTRDGPSEGVTTPVHDVDPSSP